MSSVNTCSMRLGWILSRMAPASGSRMPVHLSASRNSTRPPSEESCPPSKPTVGFFYAVPMRYAMLANRFLKLDAYYGLSNDVTTGGGKIGYGS